MTPRFFTLLSAAHSVFLQPFQGFVSGAFCFDLQLDWYLHDFVIVSMVLHGSTCAFFVPICLQNCLFVFFPSFCQGAKREVSPPAHLPTEPPTPLPEPPPPKTHQAQRNEDVKCDMWQDDCAQNSKPPGVIRGGVSINKDKQLPFGGWMMATTHQSGDIRDGLWLGLPQYSPWQMDNP